MTTSPTTDTETAIPAETTRHVRVQLPDRLYRSLRHRLIDVDADARLSDLIVALLYQAIESSKA